MDILKNHGVDAESISYQQCLVNLNSTDIQIKTINCKNMEDVLGGFGRSYQILAKRHVEKAYSEENPLIVSTGLLTGTAIMTGLRTYFSSYSPLKVSNEGLPGAMWSAASGKFGTKLRWTGIDEIIFEGRSIEPVLLHVKQNRCLHIEPGKQYKCSGLLNTSQFEQCFMLIKRLL